MYHTNVMMAVGSGVAIVCADSVKVSKTLKGLGYLHMLASDAAQREDIACNDRNCFVNPVCRMKMSEAGSCRH